MAKPSIFTDRETAFLRELVRQKVDFLIVGMSAATLQGAPGVTQDIDLWFRDLSQPGLRKALGKVGGIFVPATAHTPPVNERRGVAPAAECARIGAPCPFFASQRCRFSLSCGRCEQGGHN